MSKHSCRQCHSKWTKCHCPRIPRLPQLPSKQITTKRIEQLKRRDSGSLWYKANIQPSVDKYIDTRTPGDEE